MFKSVMWYYLWSISWVSSLPKCVTCQQDTPECRRFNSPWIKFISSEFCVFHSVISICENKNLLKWDGREYQTYGRWICNPVGILLINWKYLKDVSSFNYLPLATKLMSFQRIKITLYIIYDMVSFISNSRITVRLSVVTIRYNEVNK